MINLAIECSGTAGSVAIFDGNEQLEYLDLDPAIGSVQSLAAAIQSLVGRFPKPHLISVTHGPGSFTGLRVGLTTAKMLAWAWKIPVAPVDTLHAIALRGSRYSRDQRTLESGASFVDATFIPVINAFRKQVFSAAIAFTPDLQVLAESRVLDGVTWQESPLESLTDLEPAPTSPTVLCGSGLRTFPLQEIITRNLHVLPESIWNPTASEVGFLGAQLYRSGVQFNAFSVQPLYLRASAAEEQAKG